MEQELVDSLHMARQILNNVPFSYWATSEPWRIIVMSLAVVIMLLFEPTLLVMLIKFKDFRLWFKKWVENGDHEPNTIDMTNLLINWLISLVGRTIVIASFWWFVFHEDQIALITTLGTILLALITRNSMKSLTQHDASLDIQR